MRFDIDDRIIDFFDDRFGRSSAADRLRFQEFCSWTGVAVPLVHILVHLQSPVAAFMFALLLGPNIVVFVADGVSFRRARNASWSNVLPRFAQRAAINRGTDGWLRLAYLVLIVCGALTCFAQLLGLRQDTASSALLGTMVGVAWGLRWYAITVPPPPSEFEEQSTPAALPEPAAA